MGQHDIKKKCRLVLNELTSHEWAFPFNIPVDPVKLNILDYFSIIKNPIDLGTIKQRIKEDYYKTLEEYLDDINLVWDNCLTYNRPGSEISIMAETLIKLFKKLLKKHKINDDKIRNINKET